MSFIQHGMWQGLADAVAQSDVAHDSALSQSLLQSADDVTKKSKGRKVRTSMQTEMDVQATLNMNSPIRSPEFFTYSCALVKDIIKETRGTAHQIDPEDVLSLFYIPPSRAGALGDKDGACINAHLAKLLLAEDTRALELLGLPKKMNLGKHYQAAFKKLANDDGQVSVMLIRPKFDPMGPIGTQVSRSIRAVLPKYRGLLEISDNNYSA